MASKSTNNDERIIDVSDEAMQEFEQDFAREIPKGQEVRIAVATTKSQGGGVAKMTVSPSGTVKGGDSQYATSENFTAPQPPGEGTGTAASGAINAGSDSTPLTQQGATGGALNNYSDAYLPTAKELAAAEAATAGLGDLRDPNNTEQVDSYLGKQGKKENKEKAKNGKHGSSSPIKDLRAAEDAGSSFFKNGGGKHQKANLYGKFKKYAKKKTAKIILGGVGLSGAFFLLMLIMFLLGALLIPHFMSNVIGWQFLRVTRASYESTQEVLEEQENIAAETGKVPGSSAKDKYEGQDDTQDGVTGNQAYDGEANLTPQKMNDIEKVMDDENLTENYVETPEGEQLNSVTTKNLDPLKGEVSTTDKVTSGFDGTFDTPSNMSSSNSAETATEALAEEDDTADADTGASAVYESVQKSVLENEIETADDGWEASEFGDGNSQKQDDINGAQASFNEIDDDSGVGQSSDSTINGDTVKEDELLKQDMSDPSEVEEVIATDGNLPSNVIKLINSDFVQSALDSAATKIGEYLDPASGKLIPFCIVDEGSKYNGPAAEAQSNEVQRSFVLTAAVQDEQKRGSPYVTAGMVGAMNRKLEGDSRAGGVSRSIPLERASGEKVSTQSVLSTEGSPLGSLQNQGNILSALHIPAANELQSAMDTICPAITNIWVNLGLGVANLTYLGLAAVFTGGSGDALEGAADAATEEAANVATEEVASEVTASLGSRFASAGFDVLKDFGQNLVSKQTATTLIVQGGLTALATFIAKFLVLAQSGTIYSGITEGIPYDNGVDQGGDELANATVANAYGGRPLNNVESLQVQQDDQTTLAEFNASQSAYQRYLALSNPNSLASVLADRVASNLNYGFFNSVIADIGNVFNPASLMPQVLFGSISGQANAASNIDTEDYGDVQQGYSDAEYALIRSTPSYRSPAENLYQLQASGDENKIAQTYGPCFDDTVATLLSTDTNGVPDIVRDANGDVSETQGLCSPQNLGPNNPQYGDLVFRYRLSLSYNTTINILNGIANAT